MKTLTLILILSLIFSLIWAGNILNDWCDENSKL